MFATFEGPEGAGKSTVIGSIAQTLRGEGREVLVTREPGEGVVGEHIRDILLHGEQLDPKAEMFLFLADRAQHVASSIRPALARGAIVLCDRYGDSSVVYQGYARKLDRARLRRWNAFATGSLRPDLTVLLDLPPEVGLARQAKRDRLDTEPIEFHAKVRRGFLLEAKLDPARWVVIDANRPAEKVVADCLAAVRSRLRGSSAP